MRGQFPWLHRFYCMERIQTVPLTTVGKIGFIGGGNMAEAFIKGLMNGGFPAENILFSEPDETRRQMMEERYGVRCAANNMALVTGSDIVVLAIKPQILDKVLEDVTGVFNDEKLLISILAGITTTRLEAGLGGRSRVVRAMPNTPSLVGQGAAALCCGKYADQENRRVAQHLFESVGIALWVEEGQMDAVTGLSGSGPAFVFSFIEALAAGGVQGGLSPETALALAAQTVAGAALLLQEAGETPASLRQKVCSPGGTTLSGVRVLEERDLYSTVMQAVGAATERSRELGRQN